MATSTSSHSLVKTDSTLPPVTTRSAGSSPRATAIHRGFIAVKDRRQRGAGPALGLEAEVLDQGHHDLGCVLLDEVPRMGHLVNLALWEEGTKSGDDDVRPDRLVLHALDQHRGHSRLPQLEEAGQRGHERFADAIEVQAIERKLDGAAAFLESWE